MPILVRVRKDWEFTVTDRLRQFYGYWKTGSHTRLWQMRDLITRLVTPNKANWTHQAQENTGRTYNFKEVEEETKTNKHGCERGVCNSYMRHHLWKKPPKTNQKSRGKSWGCLLYAAHESTSSVFNGYWQYTFPNELVPSCLWSWIPQYTPSSGNSAP